MSILGSDFFFSRYRSILLEDSFIKDPLDALNSRKYYFVSKSNEWYFIFCLQTFNKRLLRSSFLRMKNQLEKLSEITSLYQSLDTSRFQLFLSYDFNIGNKISKNKNFNRIDKYYLTGQNG